MTTVWLKYGVLILASYLWGSICWGLVFSFAFKHEDIRFRDNPGLSGSIRQYGWFYGLAVGVLDAAKGYALGVVLHVLSVPSWVHIAAYAAVVIGHNWPVFFQFHGGGGIATAIGILLREYPLGVIWALPFAAVAAVVWKLSPRLKAKVHFSPFITAVGAFPFVLWLIINRSWYPDYLIGLVLASSILLKGNQFHLHAQQLRSYANEMKDYLRNHLQKENEEPPER